MSSWSHRAALAAFAALWSAALLSTGTFAGTLFVSPAGGGSAFTQASPGSLGDALLAANGGDVLYLAGGTYTGSGSWVAAINVNVTLYGGWDGTTTFPVVRDPAAYPSILDGGGAHGVVGLGGGLTVTLDGLTIRNGLRTDSGGGIKGANDTLTLNNVTVTLNKADSGGLTSTYGGGVYLQGGHFTATRSTFSFNKAYCQSCTFASGGGLYLSQTSLDMEDCVVKGNDAWTGSGLDVQGSPGPLLSVTILRTSFENNGRGQSPPPSFNAYAGGAMLVMADAVLDQDSFLGNNAASDAGAFWADWCNVHMTRCLIVANTSYENGAVMFTTCNDVQVVNSIIAANALSGGTQGSLYFLSSMGPDYLSKQILHNTIANPGGPSSGNAVILEGGVSATLRDNIIAGHAVGLEVDASSSADVNATLWGGGPWANGIDAGGGGAITFGGVSLHGDPLFVDPPDGDYHILPASPAVDAGVNAGVTVDYDGETRPQRAGFDIGADEVPPCDVECTATGPGPDFAGTPVAFTSTVSPSNCIAPPIFDWNFGDGLAHSALQNPLHAYPLPGVYDWTLDVTTDGVTCHQSGSATACGITCTASPSVTTGYTPLPVAFTGSASATNGCEGALSYDWDFGDASPHSSEQNPSHTYTIAGDYTWILTVSAGGTSCVKTGAITVCTFTSSGSAAPASGFYPLQVSFTGSGTVAGDCSGTATIQWDFGDGSTGGGTNPTHAYGAVGTYHWTMTAALGQLRGQQAGTITVCALTCGASASTSSGAAPLLVNFSGSASATGGCAFTPIFDWDFGDGSTHSQLQNPPHTYASAGTFTWHVTVSGGGQTCSQSGAVTVCALSCSAQASASLGFPPLGVDFMAQSSLSGGCNLPVTYDWAFGDGTPHSSQQNLTHAYTAPGGYTWLLTVSSGGQTCTKTGTVTVCGLTCSAASSTALGFAPLAVSFTGSGTVSGGCTDPVTYGWTFGDGSPPSSLQNPPHTYSSAGTFTWTLTVTAGAVSCAQSGTVTACALTCSASSSSVSGVVPLAETFTATASSGACGGSPAFDWDFGDGSSHGSGASPGHTYATPGTYTWTVTVSQGGAACTSTGQVVAEPPCAISCAATVQALGSVGLAVPCTGSATPSDCAGETAFDWDFGDGSPHGTVASMAHTYNAAGTFTWTFRAVAQGAACTRTGTLVIVNPPVIGALKKSSPPLKITVVGSNLQQGIRVFINGTEWTSVVYKKNTKIQLTGSALKNAVPKGVPTPFEFLNPDGGEALTTWSW